MYWLPQKQISLITFAKKLFVLFWVQYSVKVIVHEVTMNLL